jgi:hypothetical protein
MGFLKTMLNGGVSSSDTSSNTSGTTTGTGTTTQNLNGAQTGALGNVSDLASTLIDNPTKNLQPLQTAAVNKVNAGFSSTLPSLRAALLSAGGDASGKFGNAVAGANMARIGQIADTNTSFANMALQQQNQGASLAMQLLNHIFGSTTTGTSSTNNVGSSSTSGWNLGLG